MSVIRNRKYALIGIDVLIIVGSIWLSYIFRFNGSIPEGFTTQIYIYSIMSVVTGILFMYTSKLYHRVWQYASVGEIISIFRAVTIACVLAFVVTSLILPGRVPLSIFFRTYETILIGIGGSRFLWRIYRDTYYKKKNEQSVALIIGAGDCGVMVAKELTYNPSSTMYPVAFVDDNPTKHNQHINGIPVVGDRNMIMATVADKNIEEIIIAIPSASKHEITEIIDICKLTRTKLKIIPTLNDLIQGKVTLNAIRDVEVEDLLGRNPVELQLDGIADYIHEKVILVTGAGGSIGSELCRQIAPFLPEKLILLGHGENSIYQINKELTLTFPGLNQVTIIADIQDRKRIERVFEQYRPHVVFHAAAHKHVPLMELNPGEAVKNNVFGTKNVAECADLYNSERFVLISSDKAVNPTSIMGATKRIAEMFIQCLDKQSQTNFSAVRFGNVLGSNGSVIPLFKEQIARGGPVTVTDADMIRYFMTIPEASRLVMQSGAFARGGEIFILDMGKPVRIADLATDLIRLSGYEPNVDIHIEYTGIRDGEKLFEELLTSEEGLTSTKHNSIFVGRPIETNRTELEYEMKKLEKVLGEDQSIRELLRHIVPTYIVKKDKKILVVQV